MRKIIAFVLFVSLVGMTVSLGRSGQQRDSLVRYRSYIDAAEKEATPEALRVLQIARKMVIKKEIVVGACWDWLNAAYNRAGFPANKRQKVFTSTIKGPYAKLSAVRPGDWIYHVNHSYHNVPHSGMFIGWIDAEKHQAVMLSYGGERRHKPGRYRVYDITHTYTIMRPRP